jgi:heat-inducible transcriptional repressor
LALVIREYTTTDSRKPVGSKLLAERYLPALSSATIRNDMAALEELGMIAAPHTSAGRVPTESGYRYFVRRLLDLDDLPPDEREAIREVFQDTPGELESWLKVAVSTLARTARSAAIVTAPRTPISQYKHMALLSVQARMVMIVLVLHGGYVCQQMLTLSEALPQDSLSAVANRLNSLCEGKNADELRAVMPLVESELDREVLDLVLRILTERDNTYTPNIYGNGLSELLPEIRESETAKQALRIMEEQTLFPTLLADMMAGNTTSVGDVQVVIGGEGRWNDIRHLSVVMSQYGVDGGSKGALAVFGPMRMQYGRAVASVRYVASVMTNMLVEVYGFKPTQKGQDKDEGSELR